MRMMRISIQRPVKSDGITWYLPLLTSNSRKVVQFSVKIRKTKHTFPHINE